MRRCLMPRCHFGFGQRSFGSQSKVLVTETTNITRELNAATISTRKYSFITTRPVSLLSISSTRSYSTSNIKLPPVTDYEDVKQFLDDGGLVVDVREAKELQNDGVINKAVHIPLRQVKEAFEMNPELFEKTYKVKMPDYEDPIIFSCLAGIRSAKAASVVNALGFTNTSNYKGGFADWVQKNKQ